MSTWLEDNFDDAERSFKELPLDKLGPAGRLLRASIEASIAAAVALPPATLKAVAGPVVKPKPSRPGTATPRPLMLPLDGKEE
jgi:hypothetical protein